MKKQHGAYLLSLGLLTLPPTLSNAAEDAARLCNLQGRELALKAAENLFPELDTAARQELASLAEETCLDYAGLQVSGDSQLPETGNVEEENDSGGLFSDITIVDPQDRVRRPGLKRP